MVMVITDALALAGYVVAGLRLALRKMQLWLKVLRLDDDLA
jgi:hypothetical protein